MKYYSILLLLLLPLMGISQQQSGSSLTGRVVDRETKKPLPYANIYNKTLRSGTVSDEEGYFSVTVRSEEDSIFVSYVGYQRQRIPVEQLNGIKVYLQESVQLLDEVKITASKDEWLYPLLFGCMKNIKLVPQHSKAYYSLKSYRDDAQIELVEAFFNADFESGEPKELSMKTGRFALKKSKDRFFNSIESSRALLLMHAYSENRYFPGIPFEYNVKGMKKKFVLQLEKKILDENGDSLYMISYTPKEPDRNLFSGIIWLNRQTMQMKKMTFDCKDCGVSPFMPLFASDSISSIDMHISKEFKSLEGKPALVQTELAYEMDYHSRHHVVAARTYHIRSVALLCAYDYDELFKLPVFHFAELCHADYLKINAIPYNEFFWKYNDEFRMIDRENQNERFYNQKDVITNRTWYSDNPVFKKVYESPFVSWSQKRIMMKDVSGRSFESAIMNRAASPESYRLGAKLFMDINTYEDSTNVVTSAVFDPWDTHFFLPVDSVTNCFLNMYFDIYEIHRRGLENDLQRRSFTEREAYQYYFRWEDMAREKVIKFLNEVELGSKIPEMERWNRYILDELGIDNMKIFGLKQ